MKKSFKSVAGLTLAAVLTITTCFSFNSNAGFIHHFDQAKKLLTVYNTTDNKTVDSIKEMVKAMTDDTTYETLEIGDYVSAYNVDTQETFYLYPVMLDGVVCYTAHSDMDGNVTITSNIEALASIDKLADGEEYVLYVDNGVYYAADEDETIELYKEGFNIMEEGYSFENMSFDQIYEEITNGVMAFFAEFEDLKLLDSNNIMLDDWSLFDWGNNSNLKAGQTITKKCGITNFLRQGNYGLCWACTVGTIVNFKQGRNLTGMNVADMMGIGYDDGATIYQIRDALGRYGLSYRVVTSKPSFVQVKSNIDADKPFGMCLSASNAGHAITGYGYAYNTGNTSASASTNLVYAWDSNGYQISFKHNARIISTSGYNFQWYGAVM